MRPRFVAAIVAVTLLSACTAPHPTPAPSQSVSAGPIDSAYAPWAAGRSTPVADPIYPRYGNPAIDVLHYGLELTWDATDDRLVGQATLQLRATVAASDITLDFGGWYTVDGVTVDGVTAQPTRAKNKLTIPQALATNQFRTLVVRYHGRPETVEMPTRRGDKFPLGLNVTKDHGLWTMQEPYGAFTWYPANDQPSDKALYDIAITVPHGWAGIAGGTPMGQTGDTFRYQSAHPIASYLTTLAVGRYTKETAAGPHGLPLTYWFPTGTPGFLKDIVRRSPEYLDWLERHFGRYPFDTAGTVVVPGPSAMETQQMVTFGLSDLIKAYPATADSISDDLLHEYSHQWFGDTVTTQDWTGMWLNEGWAMYAQLLWVMEREHLSLADMEQRARKADAELRAAHGPPGHPRADDYGAGNVYYCPALMLLRIHKQLGDAAFFDMARRWVSENHDTNQNRDTFIAFVNKTTGHDFTALINEYLDSPTTPAVA